MRVTAQANPPQDKPSNRTTLQLVILVILFVVVAAAVAFLTFTRVRALVSSWEITNLPGIVVKEPTPKSDSTSGAQSTPDSPVHISDVPKPQPWDGASRVTILVMGLDYRDWAAGEGAPRTDTMILLSVDPLSKTAGMLSIPRDLWVTIPGFEPNRINVAYRFGEIYQLPGGGPGLAMKTVETLLGLKVDYYGLIEFSAFERLIDEIGGVELDIPATIKVDPIEGKTIKLKPGRQVLPGRLALAYARARYTEGGDFDRAQRQQQVIMAIRDRLTDPSALPGYIAKAPALYQQLSAGVHTNMTLEQAIQLAWLLQQIPPENIKRGVIDAGYVNFGKSPEGDDVLKPLSAKIRLLRDEIFSSGSMVSPEVANLSPEEQIKAENASILVSNGASTPGLAARTKDYLASQGYNVVNTSDASETTLYTTIIDHTGNPKTVAALVKLMNIADHRVYFRYDPTSQIDIELTLGYDWANNNTMP